MKSGPQAALLPDCRRLHLNHGPIDLIVEAFGAEREVRAAYRQAIRRFSTILEELVAELAALRRPFRTEQPPEIFRGSVARRMVRAVAPHARVFVTPMAAVAGAVADEVLSALTAGRRLDRAYVNNGGDIALHLEAGQAFATGLVLAAERPTPVGLTRIEHEMPVRGIATSGRGGRSFSLGIADIVTVLAGDAAAADAAATLIANAVDVDHPGIERRPACELDPDGDLGNLAVTVAVGPLDREAVAAALDAGLRVASRMQRRGLIAGAFLSLDGVTRTLADGPALVVRDCGAATPI